MNAKCKNKIQILTVFVSTLMAMFFSVSAQAKLNVCSITINSDDEIKSLKMRYSDPEKYNFYELTDERFAKPEMAADKDKFFKSLFRLNYWFKNACGELNKSVQSCDIVLISGHYQDYGQFNGTRHIHFDSPLQLALEQMEYYSHSESCKPLFQKAQEVYLFGCQTMGKTGVRSANYTALTERVHGNTDLRVRMLFPNAKAILGFKGLAPTGADIDPVWRRYLGQLPNTRFTSSEHSRLVINAWVQYMLPLGKDKEGITRAHWGVGVLAAQKQDDIDFYEMYKKDVVQVYRGLDLQIP